MAISVDVLKAKNSGVLTYNFQIRKMKALHIPPIILNKDEAAESLRISVTTFEEEVRKCRYPKPREISKGRIGWLYEELLGAARALPHSSGLPPRNSGHGRRGKPKPSSLSETT